MKDTPTPAGAPAAARRARPWLAVLIVLLAALAVRWIAWHQMQAWPLLEEIETLADARYYDLMARQVAAGDLAGDHPYFLSPAFYYLLGLAYALFGAGAATALGMQIVLGALCCALAFALARKAFGETAGWIAGGSLALYGFFVFENLMILPDTLVLLLNLVALWALASAGWNMGYGRALAGGALIGLAAAARANSLLLVPALGLLLFFEAPGPARRRLLLASALAAGCLLAVAPFTLRNYAVSDQFVLLTTTGGRNFWKGNGPGATGTHRFLGVGESGQDLNYYLEGQVDARRAVTDSKRLSRQTWDYVARHPFETIALWAKKLMLFFHAREFGIRDQYYFGLQYSGWLRILPAAFAWIAPLGLVGVFTAWRSRRGRLLAVALLVQVASFVAIFILGRYRLVASALLAIFAAHQIVWWTQRVRARAWRPVLWTAVIAAALAALVNRPLPAFPRDEGFGDQYAAIGEHFVRQRDCSRALPALQQALEARWLEQSTLEAEQNSVRYRIGVCLFDQGRLAEAREVAADLLARLERDPARANPPLIQAARQLQMHIERAASGASGPAESTGP